MVGFSETFIDKLLKEFLNLGSLEPNCFAFGDVTSLVSNAFVMLGFITGVICFSFDSKGSKKALTKFLRDPWWISWRNLSKKKIRRYHYAALRYPEQFSQSLKCEKTAKTACFPHCENQSNPDETWVCITLKKYLLLVYLFCSLEILRKLSYAFSEGLEHKQEKKILKKSCENKNKPLKNILKKFVSKKCFWRNLWKNIVSNINRKISWKIRWKMPRNRCWSKFSRNSWEKVCGLFWSMSWKNSWI